MTDRFSEIQDGQEVSIKVRGIAERNTNGGIVLKAGKDSYTVIARENVTKVKIHGRSKREDTPAISAE